MKNIKKAIKNKKGLTNVLVTISLTAIMGFSALVIDAGLMLIERNRLVNAADAAALAGAQELPEDSDSAKEIAKEYAFLNGVALENTIVSVDSMKKEITVEVNKDVNLLFAKVLGFDKGSVNASTKAIVGPVTKVYEGIRPLAVEQQPLTYGQQVVLKENAGDGSSGNYGVVALGGSGSQNYEENLKYGYDGVLKVGDVIDTEPGNMAGATYSGVKYITDQDFSTFDDYHRDSLRIWIIPIIDSLDVGGRDTVTIVGFAAFFVEDVYKQSGQTEITGRFIRFTTNGDIDENQQSYGLMGVKLIK